MAPSLALSLPFLVTHPRSVCKARFALHSPRYLGSSFFFLITSSAVTPYGLSSLHSSFPSGRKHNRGNEVMRVTKSRENDGWARAPVPVTHILTLSGRSLQSQPFHRESFYVTGTRVPFSSCRVSPPSLRGPYGADRNERQRSE